jgi:hypothetical protein
VPTSERTPPSSSQTRILAQRFFSADSLGIAETFSVEQDEWTITRFGDVHSDAVRLYYAMV